MKRLFFLLLAGLLVVSVFAANKNNNSYVPDFAFPKQVILNADKNLELALKTGDGVGVIRSLMDYGLAESAISSDNLPAVIDKIETLRKNNEFSADINSLLNLLLARIYGDIYANDKYTYDSRVINTQSNDFNEWSGNQFREKITDLIKLSLIDKSVLQKSTLSGYSSIIDIEAPASLFYPTLYDFVAWHSINMLKSLSSFSNRFPILILLPEKEFIASSRFVPSAPAASLILDIYASLLSFHTDDIPALINVEVSRINFISRNCYSTFTSEAQQKRGVLLKSLYDKYKTNQYSGDILLELAPEQFGSIKNYYSELVAFSHRFPNYYRVGCIKNSIMGLIAPNVSVITPRIVSCGGTLQVKLNINNIGKCDIYLYRLPDSQSSFDESFDIDNLDKISSSVVSKKSVDVGLTVPFECDTIIDMVVPSYGKYVVVPKWNNMLKQRHRYLNIINCTDLVAGEMALTSTDIFVVNPVTGVPVSDALLQVKTNKRGSTSIVDAGKTDKDGFASLKALSGMLLATKGNDKYSGSIWVNSTNNRIASRKYVYAISDLPIYHPGDSVHWTAILYRAKGNGHSLIVGKKQSVVLHNANYLAIDTIECVSDNFGRISGAFILPKDQLTGTFHLSFPGFGFYSYNFTVSDYKMPSYQFSNQRAIMGMPNEGDVTITGNLISYAGVPMQGASVKLSLSASQFSFWRQSNSVDFYNDSVVTDAAGVFSFIIDKRLIENSPAPNGLFTSQLSATSISGESVSANVTFMSGKKYQLQASMPMSINNARDIELSARVLDSDNQIINTPGKIEFKSHNDVITTIDVIFPNPKVDLKILPSGEYDVKIYTTELKTDTFKLNQVVLYCRNDKLSPSSSILWSPDIDSSIETDDKGNYTLLYGTNGNHTQVLYVLSDSANIYERRWIDADAGLHKLEISLPNGVRTAEATLMSVKNYEQIVIKNVVKNMSHYNDFRISVESFRDKLIPGNEEKWIFRAVDKSGNGVESAFILSMYNYALNSLAPSPKSFVPYSSEIPSLIVDNMVLGQTISSYFDGERNKYEECIQSYLLPDFITYGQSFVLPKYFYHFALASTLTSSRPQSLNSVKIRGGETAMKMMDMAEVAEESAVDAGAIEVSTMEDDTTEKSTVSFDYRDTNVPLAFFNPMLVSDKSGVLEFSFKVPNANTTWKFNATAYTHDVDVANFASSVLANKPVMVQPNLPRFLRVGDKADIEAIVTNNSDSLASITVNITTFNPIDNSVYSTKDIILTDVAANATVSLNNTVEVKDVAMIGYRIKASTDRFADGEQAVIPVLSSVIPVIDTHPFYLNSDSIKYDLQLELPKDSVNVTLQYCDNPAWYVITALPGLSEAGANTSTQIASELYSAAVAKGLLGKYPQIKDAIRQWSISDKSDSTLVSMLERNEALKNIMLKATVWQQEAMSDTERMQRLSLLLDDKNIESVINDAIVKLKKLSRGTGGWAWSTYNDDASSWATYTVLTLFGKLNVMGFLPKNNSLDDMIVKALKYHQEKIVKDYKKYPGGDYTSFTELRDLWYQYKPSLTGNKIIAANVQQKVSKWKSYSIAGKATAAMILAKHGYKTLAKQVLKSIDEFAVTTPAKGMHWPSVEEMTAGDFSELAVTAKVLVAYSIILPDAKQIDAIRQWLILQKEARNWGESSAVNDVIASILMTSSNLLETSNDFTITYNNKLLDVSSSSYALGYLSTDISKLSGESNDLAITKESGRAAWGALYASYKQLNLDVKAMSCEDLSVDRSYYRQVGDKWVESTEFKVGDRVKVLLKVKSSRTLQYVTLIDDRASCFEPVKQIPERIFMENSLIYLENRDTSTNLFITNMPKGIYEFTYEVWVNNAGEFTSGIGKIQSQYAPQISAHTSAYNISVKK